MEIRGDAKLLRIFLGESDHVRHKSLHEAIVEEARGAGLAGATVVRGTLGFGASARIRSAKLLDLSLDLPLVVEIVDEEPKIDQFIPRVNELFEEANSGGLITFEKVQVIRYVPASRG